MIERISGIYDTMSFARDTRENILANKDLLLPYEPIIAYDTGEFMYKDEQGNIVSGINPGGDIDLIELKKAITDANNANINLDTTVNTSNTVKTQLDKAISDGRIVITDINNTFNGKIDDINNAGNTQTTRVIDTGNTKNAEVVKVGNDKIKEINDIIATAPKGLIDKNTGSEFEIWLGTKADYDKIIKPERGIKYEFYNENGEFTGGRYFPIIKHQNYYDRRISMVLDTKNGKLRVWNKDGSDVPLKRDGNKPIEEYIVEETDEYVIYSDGTQVQFERYVPGTYDKFIEIENNIELYSDVLKDYKIEWSHEDHVETLKKLHKNELEKFDGSHNVFQIDGETYSIELKPRTVPVPKYFCVRVDKKTGLIYTGNAYENIFNFEGLYIREDTQKTKELLKNGDIKISLTADGPLKDQYAVFILSRFLQYDQPYQVQTNAIDWNNSKDEVLGMFNTVWVEEIKHTNGVIDAMTRTKKEEDGVFNNDTLLHRFTPNQPNGTSTTFRNTFICRTAFPRPYCSGVMPKPKILFETQATRLTHSFVFNDVQTNGAESGDSVVYYICSPGTDVSKEAVSTKVKDPHSVIIGDFGIKWRRNDNATVPFSNQATTAHNPGQTGGFISISNRMYGKVFDWIGQIFIYESVLTEEELALEADKKDRL